MACDPRDSQNGLMEGMRKIHNKSRHENMPDLVKSAQQIGCKPNLKVVKGPQDLGIKGKCHPSKEDSLEEVRWASSIPRGGWNSEKPSLFSQQPHPTLPHLYAFAYAIPYTWNTICCFQGSEPFPAYSSITHPKYTLIRKGKLKKTSLHGMSSRPGTNDWPRAGFQSK